MECRDGNLMLCHSAGAIADEVLADVRENQVAAGCKPYQSGTGTGEANGQSASGGWYDGCGGKHCDDEVQGTMLDSGLEFTVVEARTGRGCFTYCAAGGFTWWGRGEGVSPSDDGLPRAVSFGCPLVSGYLSL